MLKKYVYASNLNTVCTELIYGTNVNFLILIMDGSYVKCYPKGEMGEGHKGTPVFLQLLWVYYFKIISLKCFCEITPK